MKRMVAMLVLVGTLSAVASADMMDLDLYKKSGNGDEYLAVVYDNDVYTQVQSQMFVELNLNASGAGSTLSDWTLDGSFKDDFVFDLSNYIGGSIPDPVQFSFAGEGYTSESVYYWGPQSGAHADRMYMFPVDSAIPEPTTMGLLALGGLAVLRRRRK